MRELLSIDFQQPTVDLSRIFLAKIVSINTETMQMSVILSEVPGTINNINIPTIYISATNNSGIIAVPRLGDLVLVAKRQEMWECVGYAMYYDKEGPNKDRTTWKVMRESRDGKYGPPPPDLKEGDFAIFAREGRNAVDFLILRSGYVVMSAGIATLVLSQQEVSLTQVLQYSTLFSPSAMFQVEQGLPKIMTPDGNAQYLTTDFLFRWNSEILKESMEFGYVNTEGAPILTETGAPVRWRLKTRLGHVLVGSDGSFFILNKSKTKIHSSEIHLLSDKLFDLKAINAVMKIATKTSIKCPHIDIEGTELKITNETTSITTQLMNIEGYTNIEGSARINGEVDITGPVRMDNTLSVLGNVRIGTNELQQLVKATVLPIIASHTHPGVMKGGDTTATSPQLGGIARKTFMTRTLLVD